MTYAFNRVLIGDCRATLPTLPDQAFQCCVTSPPYWGLRDYGNAGQLGLEPTPDEYVANMVAVFREVRRVLADDGTLWLNLGDSYAMSTKGSSGKGDKQVSNAGTLLADRRWRISDGLKAKDLVGIPWRVAFALQADGWYLRSDIIWHKPNPMPESVTDRPTKAHEYVFLLSKSERYFYDAKAIAEPCAVMPDPSATMNNRDTGRRKSDEGNNGRSQQAIGSEAERRDQVGSNFNNNPRLRTATQRNARTVWTIATQPYSGAHFATMPPQLAQRCILAGSKVGDAVLDPFMGSGTTGMVAEQLGRRWLGCDLSYEGLSAERTAQIGLGIG